MKNIKIGLIGAAGTGRTTVAVQIAEKLNIPFIRSQDITKPILDRDNYDYSEFVEFFLAERERELIDNRIAIENKHSSFVTDRTVIDHFAYLFPVVNKYNAEERSAMEELCKKHLNSYSHLFYFKRANNLKDNGIRTINNGFQTMIDYIIKGLIEDWDIPVRKIHSINAILKHI